MPYNIEILILMMESSRGIIALKTHSPTSAIQITMLILFLAACQEINAAPTGDISTKVDNSAVLTQASPTETPAVLAFPTDFPPAPIIISITDDDINSSSDNPEWQELLLYDDDQVTSAALSIDGKYLAVGYANEVCLFQLANGSQIRCLGIENNSDPSYLTVMWSPTGTYLAYFMGHHKTIVHIWDTFSGELLLVDELDIPKKFLSHAWSNSGNSLAVGNAGGGLWNWEVYNPEELIEIKEYPWAPYGLIWLPNGELLAMDDINNIEGIWNVTSGELVVEVEINADGANRVFWSPDLSTVASFIPGYGIRVFDSANGELVIHESVGNHATWSPDSKFLAIPRFDNVVVWESGDREHLVEIIGNLRGVWGVAWSQSGDLLAFVDMDDILVVIDTATWSLILATIVDIKSINIIEWSAEGLLVVGGIIDDNAGFWLLSIY